MEFSRAIRCPTVAYQLAGTKKIQQELADPNVLKRCICHQEFPFLSSLVLMVLFLFHRYALDAKSHRQMLDSFVELYALEATDDRTLDALRRASANPDAWVLKPQREGGGSLLFGEEMKKCIDEVLGSKSDEERLGTLLQVAPSVFCRHDLSFVFGQLLVRSTH